MASNSKRRSGSSDRSKTRKRVVITADDTRDGTKSKRKSSAKGRGGSGDSAKRSGSATRRAKSKREEREKRLASQRRIGQLRIGGIVALVLAVIVGIALVYNSQIFAVSAIEVAGASRLTEDEVLTLAAVPTDATLLRFPADGVADRLLTNPWIAEAFVTRDFPDGMRIRIVEREPAAYLDLGQESVWVVDDTGVTIAEQSATETGTLVVIRDLQPVEPAPGEKTGSEPILNALAVWRGLSPELQERTRAISAASIDKTTLVTHDDIEILFGPAEEMENKDLIAREILEEQSGSVVYINVRTIERPTWRGLDSEE